LALYFIGMSRSIMNMRFVQYKDVIVFEGFVGCAASLFMTPLPEKN